MREWGLFYNLFAETVNSFMFSLIFEVNFYLFVVTPQGWRFETKFEKSETKSTFFNNVFYILKENIIILTT